MMNNNELIEEFHKAVKKAENGKKCWNQIIRDHGFNKNMCIICLPTMDEALNRACIDQIEEYVRAKYYTDFYFVSIIENQTILTKYCFLRKKVVYINSNEMENLIMFMKFVRIGDNVIFVSMDEPFSNWSMVRKLNISLDNYIAGTFLWRSNAANRE